MRFQELDKLRVGVWGAGKEGCSVIYTLQGLFPNKSIVLIDDKQPDDTLLALLSLHGTIEFIAANTLNSGQIGLDVIIKSPGVSRYRSEIERAKSQGIYVTTATNLCLAEILVNQRRVIAVTGTKGKSTTSSILAFLLEKSGIHVALGGNIGVPLTDLLQQDVLADVYIAELSSYQLSDLDVWPELGIMLNLYPEHIDWHGTTANYYRDKLNLFAKQGKCIPVINYQDAVVRQYLSDYETVIYFNAPSAIHVEENKIMNGEQLVLSGEDLQLRGQHNLLNICAALSVLEYMGLAIDSVVGFLAEFTGLAHRLEVIGEYKGLTFVDDSISTTPESTMAALAAFSEQTITVLLGGKDRQQDFKALAHYVARQQVFAIVTMHENGKRIADDIAQELKDSSYCPLLFHESDLHHAVHRAKAITPQGGVVLLSPASPSYDAYKNFQERGLLFRQWAQLS